MAKKQKQQSEVAVVIGKEVIDPDIKAIYLINEAISISTPRMVKENFKFVLENNKWSKKYNLKIVSGSAKV
jgi:hypothetical protein